MRAYGDANLSQHTSAYVRQVEMHAYRDVNLHTHPLMTEFFFFLWWGWGFLERESPFSRESHQYMHAV